GSNESLGFHIGETRLDFKAYSLFRRFYPSLTPEIPFIRFELDRTDKQYPTDRLDLSLQVLKMKAAIFSFIDLYLAIDRPVGKPVPHLVKRDWGDSLFLREERVEVQF